MAFPGTYNFSYYKGDTYQFRIYPKDSSGAIFDLTKFANSQTGSVQFTMADKRGSTATTTVLCSAVISDQSILCTIRPVDGEKLTAGVPYVYDVEIQDKSNPTYPFIYTVLTGDITVKEQVTTLSSVPLTAPTNLVVTPTSTTAALSWTAPSSGNAFGYYVAYGDLTNTATAEWVAEKTAGGATPSSSDFLIALSQGLFVAVNTATLILSTSTTVTGLTNATTDNKYMFIVAPTRDSSVTLPPNIGPVVYAVYNDGVS